MSNFPINETQIVGVKDDNTIQGIVRTQLSVGELIKIPLRELTLSESGNQISESNVDGTYEVFPITSGGNVGVDQFGRLSTIIYGRAVGLRIRRSGTQVVPEFTVVIDGRTYHVSPNVNTLSSVFNTGDLEALLIVDDALEDIPHEVTILLANKAPSGQNIVLLGYLGERRAGYTEATKSDYIYNKGTLNNTNTAVPVEINFPNMKKVLYYNTDTVSRTITITWDGLVICKKTIATQESYSFEFSQHGAVISLGVSSVLLHSSDQGGVINFFVMGSL